MFEHLVYFYFGSTVNAFRISSLGTYGSVLSGHFIAFVSRFGKVTMRIRVRGIASILFISNYLEYPLYELVIKSTFISLWLRIHSWI